MMFSQELTVDEVTSRDCRPFPDLCGGPLHSGQSDSYLMCIKLRKDRSLVHMQAVSAPEQSPHQKAPCGCEERTTARACRRRILWSIYIYG